jgi:glycosyltransferase involved in cell wall biosynthesis
MRIAIITDACGAQINGVVRVCERVAADVRALGHQVEVIAPEGFRTVPCPSYPEIRLAVRPRGGIERRIDAFGPDAIHIATEGPLGFAARAICVERGWPFTTAYHTKLPEYVRARIPFPLAWSYAIIRWFHRPSSAVLVATQRLKQELEARGFERLSDWTLGVDPLLFRPDRKPALELPKPVLLYVGRVAVEKNLEAFLDLELPGTKLVVGDGPDLAKLKQRYPKAVFVGAKFGEELAAHYTAGDVFVFPSLTDTFGLVMIEALAAGLPVAAYPVTGPIDVVGGADCAALDPDLAQAVERALLIPRERCRAFAARYTWARTVELWLDALQPIKPSASPQAG